MSFIQSNTRAFIKAHNISENELARRSGVPQSTINRIVNGTVKTPQYESVVKLAKTLGMTAEALMHGTGDERQPILQGPEVTSAPSTQVIHPTIVGREIWFTIKDDAMAAEKGVAPTLVKGTQVLFDTGRPIKPNHLVFALLSSGEPLCRIFVKEGKKTFLKPINLDYPLINVDANTRVIATAVELQYPLHPLPSSPTTLHSDASRQGNELIAAVIARRRALGLTQSEFAARLGISPRTLQEWEQDRRPPSGPAEAMLRQYLRNMSHKGYSDN